MNKKRQTKTTPTKAVDAGQAPQEINFYVISEMVLFPGMMIPLELPEEDTAFVDDVIAKGGTFLVATRKSTDPETVYDYGTTVTIIRRKKTTENTVRLLLKTLSRVKIDEFLPSAPYPLAKTTVIGEKQGNPDRQEKALIRNVKENFSKFAELSGRIPRESAADVASAATTGNLADNTAVHLDLSVPDKQLLLQEPDALKRLKKIHRYLLEEISLLEIGREIQTKVQKRLDTRKRDYYLKEQLKTIQGELGESGDSDEPFPELRTKIDSKLLPDEVREEVERQYTRLTRMPPSSSESVLTHTYVECLLELPWRESTTGSLDIARAERVLDHDHFGLEMVKKRVLEFLAVRQLKGDNKGPILCFIGPPGTGKTSMGRSIAAALDRKFLRIALGGMRDENEIRGHRRTYVGAMPGRIIQGIRRAGTNNPVIMLDEIDKLGQDFRGDPASALLEVLDSEQNNAFVDNYVGLRFDLSNALFIATANQKDTIPSPLFDRMEAIELPGYTSEEKVIIAQRHLIPKQLSENGLARKNLSFHKRAIAEIITRYTREAGLRNLERKIASICRQVAHEIATGKFGKHVVRPGNVITYLGPPKVFQETALRTSIPGVATGLAWTPFGGEILFIEASIMQGDNKLILTGKLGDVMRESAMAALSFIKTRTAKFCMEEGCLTQKDIHIHVPAGAIPKDGPSAGITILLALASLLLNRPVRSDIAITGEITLRGTILPVGGIKEKILAAKRAGIKKILLPQQNSYDLDRLSETAREGLEFTLITHADEAIDIALQK